MTPQPAPSPSTSSFVLVTVLVAAAATLVAGGWALVSPATFADVVGFDRAGEHFLRDAGAFQLGLGVGLLLALSWRDPLAVVLAGFLVANSFHAVNHATDLHLGGRAVDAWGLGALSVMVGAALLHRIRRGGWVVGTVRAATVPELGAFPTQKTVVLTTYRRSGAGVGTPVSLAVDGDRAVFRSFTLAGKTSRLRHDPRATVAPSDARGRLSGPALTGRASRLDGDEAAEAARLLRRKHPLLHGVLVPFLHRALRRRFGHTVHFEFVPDTASADPRLQRPGLAGAPNGPSRPSAHR